MSPRKIAGALWFIGVSQFMLLMMIAQAVYPGYNAGANWISDLGVWGTPSALIFNSSVFAFGLIGLVGCILLRGDKELGRLPLLIAISSIGAMGVGILTEGSGGFHTLFASLAFGVGAIACLYCYRFKFVPLRYIYLGLGIMALTAFLLTAAKINFGLGMGGIERMILYPMAIWEVSLSTLLMNWPAKEEVHRP